MAISKDLLDILIIVASHNAEKLKMAYHNIAPLLKDLTLSDMH